VKTAIRALLADVAGMPAFNAQVEARSISETTLQPLQQDHQ
jgi:hypothetical protein